jgi:hypothetical protein
VEAGGDSGPGEEHASRRVSAVEVDVGVGVAVDVAVAVAVDVAVEVDFPRC